MNRYLEQIEKSADVARDMVSPALYNMDVQRRPYAHVSPEMAQALETAAIAGGSGLAAYGLGEVNPGFRKAAPYIAGATGLASLTRYGRKVDENLRRATNLTASQVRNNARAEHNKQADAGTGVGFAGGSEYTGDGTEHNYKPAIAAGVADATMGVGFGALGHQISKKFFKGKYAPGIIGGLEGAAAMGMTDMYQRKHEQEIRDLKKQASVLAAAGLFGIRKAAPKVFTKAAPKALGEEFAAGMKGGAAAQSPVSEFVSHGFTPGIGAVRQQANSHGAALMEKLKNAGFNGSVDDVFVRGARSHVPHPGLTPEQQDIVRQHMKGFSGKLPSAPSSVPLASSAPKVTTHKALTGITDLGAGSLFSGTTNLVEAAGHGTRNLATKLQNSSNSFLNRIGQGMERRSKQTVGFGHKMDHAEPKVLAGEGIGAALQSVAHMF